MKHVLRQNLVVATVCLLSVACGSSGTSYSLLPSAQGFKQATVSSKIDVLWMVDNSGSMQPLQSNLTSNFNSFMSNFVSKGYDFHLAVTSSDSYLALPQFRNDPSLAKFRDGVGSTHSGVFQIFPDTPNLINTFITNATLGINGSGDERAFSSIRAALDSPLNAGFVRQGAFLAVIILSDEDDFSDPNRPENSWTLRGGIPDHDYSDPGLESVDSYVQYFDNLTNSSGSQRRYSVSALSVLNSACQNSEHGIIGQRYMDIANKTDGVLGSVCDSSYASSLVAIQQKIIELSTQFYLDGSPIPASIQVFVDGNTVANDATDGWTYNSDANSIIFHGAAVPPAGASINVSFDPSKLTF